MMTELWASTRAASRLRRALALLAGTCWRRRPTNAECRYRGQLLQGRASGAAGERRAAVKQPPTLNPRPPPAVLSTACLAPPAAAAAVRGTKSARYVPGRVLVKFAETAGAAQGVAAAAAAADAQQSPSPLAGLSFMRVVGRGGLGAPEQQGGMQQEGGAASSSVAAQAAALPLDEEDAPVEAPADGPELLLFEITDSSTVEEKVQALNALPSAWPPAGQLVPAPLCTSSARRPCCCRLCPAAVEHAQPDYLKYALDWPARAALRTTPSDPFFSAAPRSSGLWFLEARCCCCLQLLLLAGWQCR